MVLGCLLGAATTLAVADDTDIYINPRRPANVDQPLVMFTLDYRPNVMNVEAPSGTRVVTDFFTGAPYNLEADILALKRLNCNCVIIVGDGTLTYFDQLYLSLLAVLQRVSDVKVGLMMAHKNGSIVGYDGESPDPASRRDSNGGVILYGFNSLDAANRDATLAALKAKLLAVKKMNLVPSAPDHLYQGAEIFFEFFRYLTGQQVFSGHNGWQDYDPAPGNTSNNMRCGDADSTISPACWDSNIEDADPTTGALDAVPFNNPASRPPVYVSPFKTTGTCAKVFTINFLFQVSQQDNSANAAAGASRLTGGMGFTPSNSTAINDMVAFLRGTDLAEEPDLDVDTIGEAFGPPGSQPEKTGNQNVTSFFVSNNANITTRSYAAAGGTELVVLGNDPEGMINDLTNVFNQILSVSTTFVAASVPVNVFNRAEIVDNVYFALFQAEADARWKGNLKKLKLATENLFNDDGTAAGKRFRIVDNSPTPQDAIGSADGRIVPNALTFWTDNSGALLDVGDSNGDGIVDARDTTLDSDTLADNVDPTTGQVTFPTPSTPGSPAAANPKDYVTDRDSRIIPRGGAGQKIPGFRTGGSPGDSNPTAGSPAGSDAPPAAGPRKVFYLSSSASTASLTALNVYASASTELEELKTQLGLTAGVTTDLEAQKLLRYARGQDPRDEDMDCTSAAGDQLPTATCRTEARYWMLGDPLHSRPLPINYGASTTTSVPKSLGHESKKNPAIFIAMASNDGHLRMFRNTGGTTSDTATPAELGQEVWSFIPPEGLAVQKRLLDNSKPAGESPHPYSFDGESTALIIDQNGNGVIETNTDLALSDRVILYIGLRRGGSAYYALDVTTPLNPKFLWRITPTDRTRSCDFFPSGTCGKVATTEFAEMGQTFSRPRVGRVNLGVTRVTPATTPATFEPRNRLAVFFGGGYDGGYALDSTTTPASTARLGKDRDGVMANDTKGKAIYAIRANDASLIWKAVAGSGSSTSTVFQHADLKDSIPSNLTLVDSNADGSHDRIYVGDTGGNLWRVDMGLDNDGNTNPDQGQTTDDWTLTRLACVGRHSAASAGGGCTTPSPGTQTEDRRFFHEPDVIQSTDESGRFDAVVIGSGDRENPLDEGPIVSGVKTTIDVNNFFYVIKDRITSIGGATNRDRNQFDLTDVTNRCLNNSACTISDDGWRLELDNPNGEKTLSAPVTIANSIFFTTYLPPGAATNSCGPGEGGGFLYALKLGTGAPARNYNTTDGGPNPDGSGTTDSDRQKDLETPGIPAQVVYLGTPPGTGSGGSACTVNILAGARILEAPGCPRFRTFWQREGQ